MSTTQTPLIDEPNDNHSQSSRTDSIDADIVQNLTTGDIITATQLTRKQHQEYLDNPFTTLRDVESEQIDYLVLATPNNDEERSTFAAKIIPLDDWNADNPTHEQHPYVEIDIPDDTDADEIENNRPWNITMPTIPYTNNGVVISRLGTNSSLVTHILRDITITNHKEL